MIRINAGRFAILNVTGENYLKGKRRKKKELKEN
jgi:hypothetical protein